jgi:hypothetical protein
MDFSDVRENLQRQFGAEPPLPLTFDRSNVPVSTTFVCNVDADFKLDFRNYAVPRLPACAAQPAHASPALRP